MLSVNFQIPPQNYNKNCIYASFFIFFAFFSPFFFYRHLIAFALRAIQYMPGWNILLRFGSAKVSLCIFFSPFTRTASRRGLAYALSEACFVEGVRQNSSSRGRVTPKGICAIRMASGSPPFRLSAWFVRGF